MPRADAVDAPAARGGSALPRVRRMRRPRSAASCTTQSPGPSRRRISQQRPWSRRAWPADGRSRLGGANACSGWTRRRGRVTAAHVRAMPAGWRGAAGGHRPRVERAWCAVPVAGRSGTQPQPLGWDVVGTNGGGDAGLSALYRSGVWNRRQTTDRTGRSTVVGGCVVSTAVTHPALVSEADFVAAQRVKADSTSSATPVGSTPESRRIASFSACSCRAGWGRGRLPRARTIGGRARRAGRAPVATG